MLEKNVEGARNDQVLTIFLMLVVSCREEIWIWRFEKNVWQIYVTKGVWHQVVPSHCSIPAPGPGFAEIFKTPSRSPFIEQCHKTEFIDWYWLNSWQRFHYKSICIIGLSAIPTFLHKSTWLITSCKRFAGFERASWLISSSYKTTKTKGRRQRQL